jgi:hypothetical protein
MEAAVRELGISSRFVDAMRALASRRGRATRDDLIELFTGTMEAIRIVDEQTEATKP